MSKTGTYSRERRAGEMRKRGRDIPNDSITNGTVYAYNKLHSLDYVFVSLNPCDKLVATQYVASTQA